MTPLRPARTLATLAASVLLASCSRTPPAPAPAVDPDLLLVIDGLEIRLSEVEPYRQFVEQAYPDAGRKTVVQLVLEKHLLPLRMAERAFPAERAAERQRAMDLRSVVGNVLELEQKSELQVQARRRLTRLQTDLPVAMFLFDQTKQGDVSQPIALPRGYMLTGALDYYQAPLVTEDMVEAIQIGFFTHQVGEWTEWVEAEQKRIKSKITYVHPDYREALPTWCN